MAKDQVLEEIFKDDPMGLLDVSKKTSNVRTPDERLLASFLEINEFVNHHGKEPTANTRSVSEYQLHTRLKSLRNDPEKIELLQESDIHDLLPKANQANDPSKEYNKPKKEFKSIEDILEDDTLDILGDDDAGLFDFKHTPKEEVRASPDFVARRKPCNDFEKYEASFQSVQHDLAAGKRKLIPFKQKNLREGAFYVHNGVLFYLEKINITQKEQYNPDGSRIREDGRTRCIFENGTESRMLKRSVEKILYENGRVVTENIDQVTEDVSKRFSNITEEDEEAGYIYVLKSKSKNEEIASIRNLYKIGYASNVEDRLRGAEKQPTYLMAPVEYIAGWKCYNMNPQKFEHLIHNFFGSSCLEVDVFDQKGKRYTPREWFIVPLPVIEQAIELIINGKIVEYKYDAENETIIKK